MSVKVAVRVRPFNQREEERGSVCCIEMVSYIITVKYPTSISIQNGPTTIIHDHNEGSSKNFTFDYSFWSHDHFKITPDGRNVPTSDKYADQNIVYSYLGKQVLDNAWEGYHCCLFAYGQTGSGKSYSMVIGYLSFNLNQVGYGNNKGIVPIACNEIFTRIAKLKSPTQTFEVSFSIVEIYNEKV